ncbi:MAG TPA: regulatory signaling modulator protein AmpE [Usitatibacter sp.]|nr:regulatory signaling modulator protein AmpE [Usitatibacter sp.]
MILLALLLALLAQYAYPPPPRPPLLRLYGRACLAVRQRLDAGDRNSGIFGWLVLMAVLLVPTAVLASLASRIHPAVLLVLDVAVLYGSLRFLSTVRRLGEIERSLRGGETQAALATLGEWQGQGLDAADAGAIARVAAEQALREAHQGTFGMLFWFLVLPGPVGVVLYAAALRAARSWEHRVDPHERDFGWFAGRAFAVIDWIPQRVSAFAFAIVGDFEDALFCWRTQAATWPRAEEAVVLAAGAGALEVRLGEPIPAAGAWVPRATLGVGEGATEDALASLQGMLWRALVLWLVVYVLAVALQMR